MSYKNDPREIVARFDCECKETRKAILKGEKCIYYPLSKAVYHVWSKQAGSYYSWVADLSMGYNY